MTNSIDIAPSEIVEKVYLNDNYQLVSEKDATLVRIRLKDGRTLYGYPNKDKPVKVVLGSDKDSQDAS